MRRALALALLVFVPLVGCLADDAGAPPVTSTPAPPEGTVTFEALAFDTNMGAFTAILFAEEAPESVAFMKRLVESGYYDGREFNRVIPGFVIQEVDRLGGATDQTDTVPLEAGTRVHFSMGAFGVARNEDPNSGGSEFFVMDFAHQHLYGNYAAFAQVVEGMDVVHAIARVPTIATGPASGFPLPLPVGVHDRVAVQPPTMRSVTVTSVTMPAAEAAQYPRVVGARTVLEDGTRYTPEWPADLASGRQSQLTWFVYTSQDAPPPDLSSAEARIVSPDGNVTLAVTPDLADARILRFAWTPTAPGEHTLVLHVRGTDVAQATLTVPS